jgi:hypothetical protein
MQELEISKSEQMDLLIKSLVAFKKECPSIDLNSTVKVKTKAGSSYTFDYADLPHIKSICDPILSKFGLVVSQLPIGKGVLYTTLMHESGQYISGATSIGNVENKTSQEYGSLITYFRRYAYCSIVGIVADKDDDANAADGNEAKQEKPILTLGSQNFINCKKAYVADNSVLPKIMAKYEMSDEVHAALVLE